MAQKGYLIGPQLVAKIKDTITRVEGSPYGGGGTQIPTRFEAVPSYAPKPTRIAAYPRDTFWKKGEVNEVSFYTHNGTSYGLQTLDASGTATAVNICNDLPPIPTGIDDPRLGPTPTMTWCVVSESRGGAKVVIEGPQAGTFVAAYPTDQGEWGTGQTRTVEQYFHTDSGYEPTGFTAPVINVGPPYKPLVVSEASGPSPSLAWCVVATSPDGGLVAVEAENARDTQWGTIDPGTIGQPWERTSSRTVTLPSSDETVQVVSAFDYYSPLDLPHGLVFTRGLSPNGSGTANVVIGPPPIPMHNATYTAGGSWVRGGSRTVVVPPSAGVTQTRTVVANNPYFDTIEQGEQPLAIGKFGTAYSVIAGPTTPGVMLATRDTTDQPWLRGSQRTVRITGSTSTVSVYSAFDDYSPLDLPTGIAYTKSQYAPAGGTANVVIGPPPIPMHNVTYTTGGSWVRGDSRTVVVPPSAGVTQTRTVVANNPYFDTIEQGEQPLAIGKFGTAYSVISGPDVASVKFAGRTDSGQWERWSSRAVRIHGTTNEVQAVNFVGHYEAFDGRGAPGAPGMAIAKGKAIGSDATAYYVISPSPITFRTGTFTGQWAKGASKSITLTSSPTGTITVINNLGTVGSTSGGSSTKNCSMSKEGNQWYLVAAEC